MDYSAYPDADEVYEVERTVEIHLAKGRVFRLEVVRVAKGSVPVRYDANYYERKTLYITPQHTISTERAPKAIEFHVWAQDRKLPSVDRHYPELALSQALEELVARINT